MLRYISYIYFGYQVYQYSETAYRAYSCVSTAVSITKSIYGYLRPNHRLKHNYNEEFNDWEIVNWK